METVSNTNVFVQFGYVVKVICMEFPTTLLLFVSRLFSKFKGAGGNVEDREFVDYLDVGYSVKGFANINCSSNDSRMTL